MTRDELINDINNNLLTYDINYNQARADVLKKELNKIENKIKYIKRQRSKFPIFKYLTWKNQLILFIIKALITILSVVLGLNIKFILFLVIIFVVSSSLEFNILDIIEESNYELEDLLEEYNEIKEEYNIAATKAYELTKKQNKYRETHKHNNIQTHTPTPSNQNTKKLQLTNKKVYR